MIAQAIMTNIIPVEVLSLVGAVKHFFQIPANEIMKEYKALTLQDREELREGLTKVGYKIKPADALSIPPAGTGTPNLPVVVKDDGPNYESEPKPELNEGYAVGQEHPALKVAS